MTVSYVKQSLLLCARHVLQLSGESGNAYPRGLADEEKTRSNNELQEVIRGHSRKRAELWLKTLAKREPNIFAHWVLGWTP